MCCVLTISTWSPTNSIIFFFQAEDGVRDSSVTGVQTFVFFFQAEDGIRDSSVTGVQTCALPISLISLAAVPERWASARTSLATTAKPRPCSPARAASTAALSARILVWKDRKSGG